MANTPHPPRAMLKAIDHEKLSWQVQIWMPTVTHKQAGLRGVIRSKVLEQISIALRKEKII